MQNRFLLLLAYAFVAVGMIRAQSTAPDPEAGMTAGLVLVAKVTGEAKLWKVGEVDGTQLKVDEAIPEKGTIRTGSAGGVVLAFANGATTKLGANTEMELETFKMVPLAQQVALKDLKEEPTKSRTRLKLNRGELVGDVKPLKISDGSGFVVQTPVGAAGIRGTVFRIVFIPQGNGYAFQLTTVTGNVIFASENQGAGGATGSISASGLVTGGMGVGTGGELVFTVNTDNPGQSQIVGMPALPEGSRQSVLDDAKIVAIEIAQAVEKAVFAPISEQTPGTGGGTVGSITGSTPVSGITSTGAIFTGTITTEPPPPVPPAPRVSNP